MRLASRFGCQVTRWEPSEADGWRFDPDYLDSHLTDRTKMIVVNFRHNPTGSLPSRADFGRIIPIARENNLYLFSDEMYRGWSMIRPNRQPVGSDSY